MMKKILFSFLLCCIAVLCTAQNVGIGTATPNASAMLDVSSSSKGLLMPRMTSAQRNAIAAPAKGLIVFDTNGNSYWYYNGTAWKELAGGTYNNDSTLLLGQQAGNIASHNLTANAVSSDSSGYLYDSGGPAGNYGNNENFMYTIYMSTVYQLATDIIVLSNNLESPYDSLTITDDFGHRYVLVGTATGTYRIFGTAHIQFKTNSVNNLPGFAIRWNGVFTSNQNNYDAGLTTGWYFNPAKNYMRGGVNANNNWSPDSSGMYSFAFGYNNKAAGYSSTAIGIGLVASGTASTALGFETKAVGYMSTAMGSSATAGGDYCVAMGYYTTAKGNYSTAMGTNTTASAYYSTAMGSNTTASAYYSTAMGINTKSKSYGGLSVGFYNDSADAASATSFNPLNRIFQIGNGTADNARSNAITVLQNGKVGIGLTSPVSLLDVNGNASFNDKTIFLRKGTDPNHGLRYDSTLDGPYLFGFNGGALGTAGLPNALTWDWHANVSANNDFFVPNGKIGIGTTSTIAPLNFASSLGDKVIFWTNGSTHYGIGLQPSLLQIYSESPGTDIAFGTGKSSSFSETMRIRGMGDGSIKGNLTVQNGKGIIRSTDGTQKKALSTNVVVNTSLGGGASTSINFTFPESFSASPDVYVGNVVSGAGGWAEVIMTIANVSTTGGTLYVHNSTGGTWTPNFTVKVIAIGPQ